MYEILTERIYKKPADLNGFRILVDRLWPRGISKVDANLDLWAKQIAPSKDLRIWFDHEAAKFPEFKKKYLIELNHNPETPDFIDLIKSQLKKQNVILLYGAKEEIINQATILKDFLSKKEKR